MGERALRKDIAPGESHIALRIGSKLFYLPSLFHLAPTHDRIVPLTIRDVKRSKDLLEIYGVQGLEKHSKGYVMVNNYPVKTFRVMGRLVHYMFKEYECRGFGPNPNNFFLLYLDDSSGDSLLMCVRILRRFVSFSPKDLRNDLLIEVVGTAAFVHHYQKRIEGESAYIVGSHTNFETELQWWKTVLETRKLLAHPWVYSPEGSGSSHETNIGPRFSRKDLATRKRKELLVLSSDTDVSSDVYQVSDTLDMRNDVIVVDDDSDNERTQNYRESVAIEVPTSATELPLLHSFRQSSVDEIGVDIEETVIGSLQLTGDTEMWTASSQFHDSVSDANSSQTDLFKTL